MGLRFSELLSSNGSLLLLLLGRCGRLVPPVSTKVFSYGDDHAILPLL